MSFTNWSRRLKEIFATLAEGRIALLGFLFLIICFVVSGFYLPLSLLLLEAVLLLATAGMIFALVGRVASVNQETKIERSELKSILLNLEDALLVYDQDFKILFVNPAAEKLFNLKSEEVIEKYMSPQEIGNDKIRLLIQVLFNSLAPVMVARSEAGVYPQVTDLSWDDPFLHLRTSTMPLKDNKGKIIGFMKIIRDRTREVSLLKAKNEFLTVASHQLRTPITNIKWSLESIAGEEGLNDNVKNFLHSAQEGTSYLLAVVEDLLRTSKIEEGRFGYEMQMFDLKEFAAQVVGLAVDQARRAGIKLYLEPLDDALPQIYGDKQKLTMVFENLLDNAIRYNVKDGEVIVKIEKVSDQPMVQVTIKDTGIGVPSKELSNLFTKFYRAENVKKARTDGTGLGLYIVKNIIQAHGGKIAVSSEEGRGTTFEFTLVTNKSLVPSKELPVGVE
ncbi:MAG: PAS domain-containing protein [Anaplasmataceae bacterium]|nr:PAS domain-containing protein [Anaplasmataceae bacterium]